MCKSSTLKAKHFLDKLGRQINEAKQQALCWETQHQEAYPPHTCLPINHNPLGTPERF